MNDAKVQLSIITVTWNSSAHIAVQIESVAAACKNISYEQVVVDNASQDDSSSKIKSFGTVRLIQNIENKGFGYANNQGVAIAQGEFLLFLNPDMRLEAGSLDILYKWMQSRSQVGIASVQLTDEHGKFNIAAKPRRFPKLWEQLALIFKLPHLFPGLFRSYFYNDFNPDIEQEVDSVQGAFLLLRREIVEKLGHAFDPRYYFWYEDVDLCREAKRLGFTVMYTPVISAVDYVGQSVRKQETLWKQRQFLLSMLTYFQKWEPWYKWVWIALFRPVGITLVWFKEKIFRLTGFNLQHLSRFEKKKKQGKNF
jgi:GT2 family glycosyltransferase